MIHDKLCNWSLYFNSPPWGRAFEYLSSLSRQSEEITYLSLQGDDIYASIVTYQTCKPDESVLEAHDEYIDIQMSLINGEAIEWFPRQNLEIKKSYCPDRDRTLYIRPDIVPVRIYNLPNLFTVLYPNDAHMPKLMIEDSPKFVRKVVIKVHKKLIL